MRKLTPIFLISCLLTASIPLVAGESVRVATIPAKKEDVSTLQGLMSAFYDVVNIRPGQAPQWARDRTLYAPWIRFIATSRNADGQSSTAVWTHQQYVEATQPLLKSGFKEWEVSRRTRQYGNIAHIDSRYAGEVSEAGKVEKFGGLNSIEAHFDGTRWWINSVMWMGDAPVAPRMKETFETMSPPTSR